MTFAAPLALAGAVLVGIPVLIHSLGRGKARVVRFPSLRFLPPSRVPPLTPQRIEEVGLLSLRAAAILLAAIGLSQPRNAGSPKAAAALPERIASAAKTTLAVRRGPATSFDSLILPPPGDIAAARAAVRTLDDPVVRGVWSLHMVDRSSSSAELDAAVAARGSAEMAPPAGSATRVDSLSPPSPGDDDGSPFLGRWAWVGALVVLAAEGIVRRRRRAA